MNCFGNASLAECHIFVILSTKSDKPTNMDIIERILATFQIPSAAREVYMDLVEHGGTPARLIATRLSMTRPSVYDQLKILMKFGLVVEKDRDGKKVFIVHDIEDLEHLMTEEQERIGNLQEEFRNAKSKLLSKTHTTEPKIRFMSDKSGIIQSMHDMLWDESVCLKVVWPYKEMLRVLGKDALVDFNEKRIRNGIELHAIWPEKEKKNGFHIWENGDRGVERR